jgi:hypothetical protein
LEIEKNKICKHTPKQSPEGFSPPVGTYRYSVGKYRLARELFT